MTRRKPPPYAMTFSHDSDPQPCESCRLSTLRRFKPIPHAGWEGEPRDTFRFFAACDTHCAELAFKERQAAKRQVVA